MPGPRWQPGAELTEQPDFPAQVAWWRAHDVARRLEMIGEWLPPSGDARRAVLVVWRAATEAAARALAEAAPLVASGVFTVLLAPGAPKP